MVPRTGSVKALAIALALVLICTAARSFGSQSRILSVTFASNPGFTKHCYSYRLRVDADGAMQYIGLCELPRPGIFSSRLEEPALSQLFALVAKLDWEATAKQGRRVMDAPSESLTVTSKTESKTVTLQQSIDGFSAVFNELKAIRNRVEWISATSANSLYGYWLDDSAIDSRTILDIHPISDGRYEIHETRYGAATCSLETGLDQSSRVAKIDVGPAGFYTSREMEWKLELDGDVLTKIEVYHPDEPFSRVTAPSTYIAPYGISSRTLEPLQLLGCAADIRSRIYPIPYPERPEIPLQSNVRLDLGSLRAHVSLTDAASHASIPVAVNAADAAKFEERGSSYDPGGSVVEPYRPLYTVTPVCRLHPGHTYSVAVSTGVRAEHHFRPLDHPVSGSFTIEKSDEAGPPAEAGHSKPSC